VFSLALAPVDTLATDLAVGAAVLAAIQLRHLRPGAELGLGSSTPETTNGHVDTSSS